MKMSSLFFMDVADGRINNEQKKDRLLAAFSVSMYSGCDFTVLQTSFS